jgi:putative DNA primase/helicase
MDLGTDPSILAAALAAHAAGLSVLPPYEDGTKRPRTRHFTVASLTDYLAPVVGEERANAIALDALPDGEGRTWVHRQHLRMTTDEVNANYQNGLTGLGIVAGAISGNLEVLEFDDLATYQTFCDTAEAAGLGELVARIRQGYEEKTPGGGIHWLYVCPEIAGNTKLARRPGLPDKNGRPTVEVLIETRGEGGFVVTAPSFGKVHQSGKPYELLAGGFASIATITPDERESLFDLARAFDEMPKKAIDDPIPLTSATKGGDRPGDRFNAETSWREILEPHGWRFIGEGNGKGLWTRPDKAHGVSATTNYKGSDCLYVFSTSTLFEPETSYTKFAAYAVLNHGGDFHAAGKALAATYRQTKNDSTTDSASNKESVQESDDYYHLTDLGNAERFVDRHGKNVHYCYAQNAWYVWDGSRWKRDATGEIERLVKETVRTIYRDAADVQDEKLRKAIVDHARKSESRKSIEAIIRLAQSEATIPVVPKELDADPYLLNVLNGTIDLRTGALLPHDPAYLITKQAPVVYDANAAHPMWTSYLDTATEGDVEYQAFLQRAIGYSLLGTNPEEVLFFLHGPSKAGKTTLIEALKATLGDYAASADFETWLARRDVGGPRPDLARLAGARIVTSVEVDEGKKLAEGLVKSLTGGDVIVARFLYAQEFEFLPSFTLWLAANHAPKIREDDQAIWNRIKRLPFEHEIPLEKRDPKVKETLRNPKLAGPAILAWAVRGCVEWTKHGLGIPPIVENATLSLRQTMDPLRDFVRDCCVVEAQAETPAKRLRDLYEEWTKENGVRNPISGRAWADRLRAYGCVSAKGTGGTRLWKGIRPLQEDEVASNSGAMAQSGVISGNSLHEKNHGLGLSKDAPLGATHATFPKDAPLDATTPLFPPAPSYDGTALSGGHKTDADESFEWSL